VLTAYLTQFQNLIQAPSSPIPLISTAQATTYINTARGQVAGEGECIRVYASLTLAAPTQQYPFASIALPAGTLGVAGVLNVRMATYAVAGGQKRVVPREWEWFNDFVLATPVPVAGPPQYWAQFGQGASGTLFFNLPDEAYTIALDTVCYPSPLATDGDPEAIPYLWTDAVPYYAAWLGLMSLQRQADADNRANGMMKRYEDLMARARRAATPSVLPGQFAQGPDPMAANRLGIQPGRGA
jgi:hypothetical protein